MIINTSRSGAGQIVGPYYDASGISHGFLRNTDGAIVTFDPLGSRGTYAKAINSAGQIAGFYYDANNVSHGFLRNPNGTFVSIDPPGSVATSAVAQCACETLGDHPCKALLRHCLSPGEKNGAHLSEWAPFFL